MLQWQRECLQPCQMYNAVSIWMATPVNPGFCILVQQGWQAAWSPNRKCALSWASLVQLHAVICVCVSAM